MKATSVKRKSTRTSNGTQEWSVKTVNCCTGCSHDCRYCYAKSMAVRFKQLSADQWPDERIRPKDVEKPQKRYDGQVMFPSSHDITPENLDASLEVLRKLLEAGNHVLVVSKPHSECIEKICSSMTAYKDRIKFRFTIGACDDEVLSYWEPNAPGYEERKKSLKHAFEAGFQTSVSAEPMLDSKNIDSLIGDLLPYVTDSIWVGKMNHIGRLQKNADPELNQALSEIDNAQTDEIIKQIYDRHKGNPKIKWKKEIKKVVGIPIANRDGLDM